MFGASYYHDTSSSNYYGQNWESATSSSNYYGQNWAIPISSILNGKMLTLSLSWKSGEAGTAEATKRSRAREGSRFFTGLAGIQMSYALATPT